MNKLKHILSLTLLLLCFMPVMANEEGGKVDVNGTVLGHIKDSYEWHIYGSHENAVAIPLPVIVHSSTGWHTFLSDKILEGKVYEGLTIAEEGPNAGKIVEKLGNVEQSVFDISITKTVCVLFIDSALLLLIVLLSARWYKNRKPSDEAPKGFVGFIEMLVMYVVDNMIKPSIGKVIQGTTRHRLQ